jgi:hypothetical protein
MGRGASVNAPGFEGAIEAQTEVCRRLGAAFDPPDLHLRAGVSVNLRSGIEPINGLREWPEGNLSGWFFWAGTELSEADDFFQPLHLVHLPLWLPRILPYLALPLGWRFLLAEGYEDVWFDEALGHPRQ